MRLLVIQHEEIEPAGLIGEALADGGHAFETVRVFNDEPLPRSVGGYHGLIVMGGSMSANDEHLPYIIEELELIKHAMAEGVPVLGICLGSQLLAKAAGSDVFAASIREIGWHPVFPTAAALDDPLFAALEDQCLQVFQWHGETFDLPEQATLLATHPAVPHQAFRLGSGQYGLQFHIEVDKPMIEAWVKAGASEREELGEAGITLLHRQSSENLARARAVCREMIAAWIALL